MEFLSKLIARTRELYTISPIQDLTELEDHYQPKGAVTIMFHKIKGINFDDNYRLIVVSGNGSTRNVFLVYDVHELRINIILPYLNYPIEI